MNCRVCGGASFGDVIDLGLMPLVNNLLRTPDEVAPRWPLQVVYCRSCSLVQLTESPPPQEMFDEYLYFSSQSQTMVRHAADLVQTYVKSGQRVLEIASNDGYLLKHAQTRGATVLGIDPASNIVSAANAQGIPTECAYYDQSIAYEMKNSWGEANVLFANNVLAHVPDPNEIAAAIKISLASNGIAHVEVPWVVRMIATGAFDTIYHEHQCYFSLSALRTLFNRNGLRIIASNVIDIHGGSLHLQITHEGDESQVISQAEHERTLGIFNDDFYSSFAQRAATLKTRLDELMSRYSRVVGYGAAAKGVVLLNYLGFDKSRITWVTDISPYKQGRYIPGTGQPVVSPDMLSSEMPPAALLLPWNIKDEVVRRNRNYINQGGSFIVPIPDIQVIDKFALDDSSVLKHEF